MTFKPRQNILVVLCVLSVTLFARTPAWAQAKCSQDTACRANGHSTISPTLYPYTEEITNDHPNQTPVTTPQVIPGSNYNWTMISGPCVEVQGNLNGTQAFNALLRAQVQVQSTTSAPGARYEVQFRIDGQESGWYQRKLRGNYPQLDVFAAMAPNVPAGWHQFTVWARLLDPGSITLSNTYTTAQGSPTTNGGAKSVNGASITLTTTFFQPVTDTVTVTLSESQDLVVQAYMQVNSGTAGTVVDVRPFLDGSPQNPITGFGIPPYLSDGVNVLTVVRNVAPGTHTISLNARTNGFTVGFSNRAIDVVGFPASLPSTFTSSAGSQTLVQTPNSLPQPLEGSGWIDGCGYWTELLEGTIATPPSGSYNHMYLGYIRVPQNVSGAPVGQLVFDTYFNPSTVNDGGGRFIEVPSYPDGFYIFGDAMLWYNLSSTETIRMWARKTVCGGPPGSFYVSDRYMWVKHIPVIGGCWYGP